MLDTSSQIPDSVHHIGPRHEVQAAIQDVHVQIKQREQHGGGEEGPQGGWTHTAGAQQDGRGAQQSQF